MIKYWLDAILTSRLIFTIIWIGISEIATTNNIDKHIKDKHSN